MYNGCSGRCFEAHKGGKRMHGVGDFAIAHDFDCFGLVKSLNMRSEEWRMDYFSQTKRMSTREWMAAKAMVK